MVSEGIKSEPVVVLPEPEIPECYTQIFLPLEVSTSAHVVTPEEITNLGDPNPPQSPFLKGDIGGFPRLGSSALPPRKAHIAL